MGRITASDRLVFTLLFSIIIYLTILFGISFDTSSPPTNQPLANLDITLVKQQTELAPDQADFLAQANNDGGGEVKKKPTEPIPSPTPKQSVTKPVPKPIVKSQPIETSPAKQEKALTQAKAERKIKAVIEADDKSEDEAKITPKPTLSARDLMFQARNEIVLLENKFDESIKALSNAPKKRILSSRTKEYAAAAYHDAWRKKVERIGNLNYPIEAKRQRINGSLMLSVDINPDGSVPADGIVISRSSGYKILDAAAIKIVRLAAPYAAIPENVLQNNDMITIIRTWKFETDQGLSAR